MNHTSQRPDRWHDGFGRAATRSAQLLLVLAVVTIIGYLGAQLRLVVVPVLIAVLIAAAASPLVDLLARRMPRLAATWVTLLVGLAALGGVGWLVVDAVAEQWGELRDGAIAGFEQLQTFVASGPFGLPELDIEQVTAQAEQVLSGTAVQAGAVTGATAVAQVATGVVLAFVVLFFLLKDGRIIWTFFRDQLPEKEHHRFDLIGERSSTVLGGYVRGTASVALIDAVLIGIGIAVVGVPLALPLALLVFVAAFVPIVGAVAAGAVATLIALVSNGPVAALIVLGIVVAVNQIEGNFLQPVLMGAYLSLHPMVILLALAAGSIVAGIIGAILAVPFTAVAWAAVKASRQARADQELEEARLRGEGPPRSVSGATAVQDAATDRGTTDVADPEPTGAGTRAPDGGESRGGRLRGAAERVRGRAGRR